MRLTFAVFVVLLSISAGELTAAPAPADEKADSSTFLTSLNRLVDFKGADRATLKDLLEFFTDRYEVTFIIDPRVERLAKAAAGEMEVAPLDERLITMQKLAGVRLLMLLDLTFEQIDCVPLIRHDHIFITSKALALFETGVLPADANDPNGPAPLPTEEARPLGQRALVRSQFKKESLTDALDAISEQTGVTILIAPQTADKAKTLVTARLLNVPTESAVRMLADMADLKVIAEANALYVTTPEKHAAWLKDREATRKPAAAPAKPATPTTPPMPTAPAVPDKP